MPEGMGVIRERTSTQSAAKAWNDGNERYIPPAAEGLKSGGRRIADRNLAVLRKVW